MNERIRELMVKAGIEIKSRRPYIDEVPDGYLESDNDFFLNNHDTIIMLLEGGGLENFAELIVSDAIDKIESVGFKSSNDIPFAITDLFVSQIKQHFGVK